MAETEVLKLRKELLHARETIEDLQEELRLTDEKYLNLQEEYDRNQDIIHQARDDLTKIDHIVKQKVDEILVEEKKNKETLEGLLLAKNDEIEAQKAEKDRLIAREKALTDDIDYLRKKIDEAMGGNFEMQDAMREVKRVREEKDKKEKELEHLIQQLNDLSNQTENLLAENRVLREMAGTPENFGINIMDIKLAEREKIEDYKVRLRHFEDEIHELEKERAILKARLRERPTIGGRDDFLLGLTRDQIMMVDEFIFSIRQGKEMQSRELEALKSENEKLKAEIVRLQRGGIGDFEKAIERVISKRGLGKISEDTEQGLLERIQKENSEMMKTMKEMMKNMGRRPANVPAGDVSHTEFSRHRRRDNEDDEGASEFISKHRIPPVTQKAKDGALGDGHSFRFGQKDIQIIPFDKDRFGADKITKDEFAFMELALIECIELHSRKDNELKTYTIDFPRFEGKLRQFILQRNELYKEYARQFSFWKEEKKANNARTADLHEDVKKEKIKNADLEKVINDLQVGMRDPELKQRLIELTKKCSILEVAMMQLTRKHLTLQEEYKIMHNQYMNIDKLNNEKDLLLEERIRKLKDWKSKAVLELKYLYKKLRESVSQNKYEAQHRELGILREKEVHFLDTTLELNNLKSEQASMERNNAENEEKRQEAEAMRNDAEQELQNVTTRLKKKDPQYAYEKAIFDRIISSFKRYKLSPQEAFESFDKNKDGCISREEFGSILQQLNIDISFSDMEAVMKFMDLDSSGAIRYKSFIRTLKRYGIHARTKEDEILQRVAGTLKRKYITLDEAFKIFDRHNRKAITRVEFMDNLKSMAHGVREEDLTRLINSIYPEETTEIDYRRFCRVFEKMLEKKPSEEKKLPDNWKIEKMSEIDFKLMENRIPLAHAFNVERDGTVPKSEFARLCETLNVSLTPRELDELYGDFAGKARVATYSDIVESIISAKASTGYLHPGLESSAPLPFERKVAEEFDIDSLKTKILILQEREKIALDKVKRESEQGKIFQELVKKRTEENDRISEQLRVLTTKYFELENNQMEMQNRVAKCISIADSAAFEKKFEIMERDLIDKDCAMQTYKSMYEALAQQMRSLELAFGRKKDEVTDLHRALLEIQSHNDKDNLIGKLYYVILLSRWAEGTTNRKYDESLTELKRTRNALYAAEAEQTKSEDIYRGVEERLRECSRIITDQREQIKANTITGVSLEKLRELAGRIKSLTDEKIDVELASVKLRAENTRLSSNMDELENAKNTWQEVAAVLRNQTESELGRKIIELSERHSRLKLSELRANRDAKAAGEKSSYMEKLYSDTVVQLKKLEEELAMTQAELLKKEEEYRLKDNERERMFFELKQLKEAEPLRIPQQRGSIFAPIERPQELIDQEQAESNKKYDQFPELLRQLQERDELIKELRANLREAEKASKPDYEENKKLDIEIAADIEKKQMAEVAFKTIKTLESIIKNQKEQLKRKDDFLRQMREETEQEREGNAREINRLQQELAGETQNAMGKIISYGKEMSQKITKPIGLSELGIRQIGDVESLMSKKDVKLKELQGKVELLEHEVKARDIELRSQKSFNHELQSKLEQIDREEQITKTKQDLVKTKAELSRVTKEYGKLKAALDKLRQDMSAYTDKNVRQEADINALATKEKHYDKDREQIEKILQIANNKLEKQKKAVNDAHEVLQAAQRKEIEFNNEIKKLQLELDTERMARANMERMLENEKAKQKAAAQKTVIINEEKKMREQKIDQDSVLETARLKAELLEYKLRLLDQAYDNEILLNPELVVFEAKYPKPLSNIKYIDEFIDKACEMIHPKINPLEIFRAYADFKPTISQDALWHSLSKIGITVSEDVKPILLRNIMEGDECSYEMLGAALQHKLFAKFMDPELLTLGKQAIALNLPNSELIKLFADEFGMLIDQTKVELGLKKIHAFDQPRETNYIVIRSQTLDKYNVSTIIALLEKGAKTSLIEELRSSYSPRTLAENFARADANMDRKISKLEFEKMLLSMRYAISEQKVRLLSSIFDPTNSGLYSFNTFCFHLDISSEDQQIYKALEEQKMRSDSSIVTKRTAKLIAMAVGSKLIDEFQRLDYDESGLVSRADALALFTELQVKGVKKGELQMMLQEFDTKGINYYSYHTLVSKIGENAQDGKPDVLLRRIQNICSRKGPPLSTPGGFRQAFLGLDREGKITGIKFKAQLCSMIPGISEEELEILHQKYREQDGRVDPKYFVEDLFSSHTRKPVPLSTVSGMTTTEYRRPIRTEAERGPDFKVDQALKGKLEELKKENDNIKKENNLLNHRVAQLEKMKMDTLSRPLEFKDSKMIIPKRITGEAFSGDTLHSRPGETPAQYSSKLTTLEKENLGLLKKIETEFKPLVAKQKSDIEKLKADIKFLKLDNLKLQSQVEKMLKRPMDNVELKSEQEFLQKTLLKEQQQKIENQQKEIARLEERTFGLEQSKLELQFERENFELERSRMERRIKDLEEFQSHTHFK